MKHCDLFNTIVKKSNLFLAIAPRSALRHYSFVNGNETVHDYELDLTTIICHVDN
jgi:hypothetical protein